jgi:phage shock protein PspC (stress-responsive transcriptional regulator)
MNKTVTINIGGIIFHIEEDAYEKLGNYLKAVGVKFSVEDGRDEIMADIEARIAESLQGKTGPSKQVVLLADVDHVISIMGEPEAISDKEEKTNEEKPNETATKPENGNPSSKKRLYRDTDEKVIAGICSGLGHYFGIDPVWFRIGFSILLFLFMAGFFLYVLLLILIPKAETTAEKLEMRGEPVDINNISRTIKEEFEGFKKKVETFGKETKRRGSKWQDEYGKWNKKNPATGIDGFFRYVFRFISRLFAFGLILFGIVLLLGIITSSFAWRDFAPGIISNTIYDLFPDNFHFDLAVTAFILIVGIPIVMMIYKGIRILIGKKTSDKYVGLSALTIWVVGIVMALFSTRIIIKGFSNEQTVEQNVQLVNLKQDTIYLNVKIDREMENEDYYSHLNQKFGYAKRWKMISYNGDALKLGYPHLRIIPSETDSVSIVIYKTASGATNEQAMKRANAIGYHVVQKDSLITFDSYFTLGPEQFWRCQDVVVELRIPKNKVIYIHGYLRDLLSEAINTTNTIPEKMVDRRWKMTDKGLECIDRAGLEIGQDPFGDSPPSKKDSVKADSTKK